MVDAGTPMCPECETDNVQSWTYESVGKPQTVRVIDCNECGETFEENL